MHFLIQCFVKLWGLLLSEVSSISGRLSHLIFPRANDNNSFSSQNKLKDYFFLNQKYCLFNYWPFLWQDWDCLLLSVTSNGYFRVFYIFLGLLFILGNTQQTGVKKQYSLLRVVDNKTWYKAAWTNLNLKGRVKAALEAWEHWKVSGRGGEVIWEVQVRANPLKF